MKRQKVRNAILLVSMLLFPITINYFSPYLIVLGSFSGIASGSFLIFTGLFVSSLFLGRAFCGWICPAGGIQECSSRVNEKPAGSRQNYVKFFIWVPWIITIAAGFITAGGIKRVQPLFLTDRGISVSSIYGYFIYLPIVALILAVSFIFGKRSFCRSICWMAPFMIIGGRIKNKLKYPSLHLEVDTDKCINCRLCDKNCPMGLQVSRMVKERHMNHDECILCGKCQSVCGKNVIHLGVKSASKSTEFAGFSEK